MSILPVVLFGIGIGILLWGWRIRDPIEKNSLKTMHEVNNVEEISPKYNIMDINQRRRSIPDNYLKAAELREQGYSYKEIAEKLETNQYSVRLMLMLYTKENKHEDIP